MVNIEQHEEGEKEEVAEVGTKEKRGRGLNIPPMIARRVDDELAACG